MRTLSFADLRVLRRAVLLAGALLCGAVGCDREDQQVARTNAAKTYGPVESFNRVLERVKRRIEQRPRQSFTGPGLALDASETSHFSYQEKVTGEVFEPENEDDTYTARIIVETESVYVHTQHASPANGRTKPPAENGENGSALDVGEAQEDASPLELPEGVSLSGLTDEPATPAESGSDSDDEEKRLAAPPLKTTMLYELAYEDGKWVRKTEVDEESMKLIFDYALEGQ